MNETKTLVLNHKQVQQKITRMAYEIYERNVGEAGVVVAGISGMGYRLALLLAKKLEEISPLKVEIMEVKLDKFAVVQGEVVLSKVFDLEDHCLILVDDVLNTGKTLAYALKPFLEIPIRKIEIAVLVNRSHKLFPVTADYTGFALATTLSERIAVDLEGENYTVHLH
ncbi:phosphoribosyltransferase family protein [Pararhodonellum marinum]|uniref:phosphoribosyltransferase family protein n=1 Tax=Pararhodonellum marinum TaxID=2755358 RepID=UPI00188E92A8|nr:phosphoribosyltransferase family protein [Pararhodonellum marinum]